MLAPALALLHGGTLTRGLGKQRRGEPQGIGAHSTPTSEGEDALLRAASRAAGELFGEQPRVGLHEETASALPRFELLLRGQARPASGQGSVSEKATVSGAGAALVGYRVVAPLALEAGVLVSSRIGAMARAAWIPFNLEGRLRPVLALEVPVVFTDSPSVGIGASVGLEWVPVPWLALGLELPVSYYVAAPEWVETRLYVFGALTAALRL